MDYKRIYKELIIDKANLLIVNYKNHTDKYSYNFKHHILDDESTLKLTELMIDDIVFYAYSEDEILNKYRFDLSNLRNAAKHAFAERLAKRHAVDSDGLIGEVMLDIIIQKLNKDAKKIFTRAKHVRQGDNNEITGYDSAFFVRTGNEIQMWLGQAKAGQLSYCRQGICDDLNEKYLDKYFCDSVRYMVDKSDGEPKDPGLLDLIKELNQLIIKANYSNASIVDLKKSKEQGIFEILTTKNVTVVIPCLIMFDADYYSDSTTFSENIEKIAEQIIKYFEAKDFTYTKNIELKILFISLPTKELKQLKTNLINVKKEAQ